MILGMVVTSPYDPFNAVSRLVAPDGDGNLSQPELSLKADNRRHCAPLGTNSGWRCRVLASGIAWSVSGPCLVDPWQSMR